jgi:serine/threonine protein kinase
MQLPVPGSMIGGRYRVEEALGQGGMGAIFAATNVATGRAVAIKLLLPQAALSPDALQRFLVEARATSRIEHPNVISVFDVGEEQGMPFLVMERLRGESLGARLERGGKLSLFEALDILIAACRGLAEAHREGVVHRDLKPDNIFLCQGKDGSSRAPKVLDFGVSKLYEDPHGRSLTQTGVSMGTPEYMCPEQINAPRDVDPLFDVYSMGIVLYQTITGRPPYQADNLYQLVQQIAGGRATSMRMIAPEVPAELEAVVMRAMHARRELRHQSIGELITDLEAIRTRITGPTAAVPAVALAQPQAWASPPSTGPAYGPQGFIPQAPHPSHAPQPHAAPSYAPSYAPSRPPSPPVPYAAAPAKSSSLVLIFAIGGGLALVGLLAAAIVLVLVLRPSDSDDELGGGSGSLLGSDDPLRPEVDLRFSGACTPRFDGATLAVTANNQGLNVSSLDGNTILGTLTVVPGVADMRGTIQLSNAQFQRTQMQIGVMMAGQRQFWNWQGSLLGADPITGTITVAAWDPAHGVMDLRFDDVTLQEALSGALCRVQGRVRTRGLTWGTE